MKTCSIHCNLQQKVHETLYTQTLCENLGGLMLVCIWGSWRHFGNVYLRLFWFDFKVNKGLHFDMFILQSDNFALKSCIMPKGFWDFHFMKFY